MGSLGKRIDSESTSEINEERGEIAVSLYCRLSFAVLRLGCTENLAVQRVTYARRRLAAFIEQHGVDVVAAWYAEGGGQAELTDTRAQRAFVAEYVAAQEARYVGIHHAAPKRRLREDWKTAARAQWVQQTHASIPRPDYAGGVPVAAD